MVGSCSLCSKEQSRKSPHWGSLWGRFQWGERGELSCTWGSGGWAGLALGAGHSSKLWEGLRLLPAWLFQVSKPHLALAACSLQLPSFWRRALREKEGMFPGEGESAPWCAHWSQRCEHPVPSCQVCLGRMGNPQACSGFCPDLECSLQLWEVLVHPTVGLFFFQNSKWANVMRQQIHVKFLGVCSHCWGSASAVKGQRIECWCCLRFKWIVSDIGTTKGGSDTLLRASELGS